MNPTPETSERLARIETLLNGIDNRLSQGSRDFAAHDKRINELEDFQLRFETSKNVLLVVAAGFGSFVTAVTGLILTYLHRA